MEPIQLDPDLGAWRTEGSSKDVAMAGAASLRLGGALLEPKQPFPLHWVWQWRSVAGQVAQFDRLIGVARQDGREDDPVPRARAALARNTAHGWREVLFQHEQAWKERWDAADVIIEGDDKVQQSVRFAIYHLTSAANPSDERVSIGARALTGDAYFGHVFWDTEIYLLPFYTAVWPEAARALLMYRFHTLAAARLKARHAGCAGALYAWESADSGAETTPERVVAGDGSIVEILTGKLEQHISADIAYAVWQYWRATGDDAFFLAAGAEIVLETARFWASRAKREADGKRHIRGVIGPDEYHENIDDNAFTNLMACWNITRGLESVDILKARWPQRAAALLEALALSDAELTDWRDAADTIVTGLDPKTGIYEQFAGFHSLEKFDLAAHAGRTVPIDVIIGAERTRRSQIVKQADVVALIGLLPEAFPAGLAEANFRYYEPLCAHGSSLSAGMHAVVAARLGHSQTALRYLREAAARDLDHDPNSAGGVRIAGLGSVWQAVVLGFGGLDLTGDILAIDPKLPDEWRSLSFRVCWRGRSIGVHVHDGRVEVTLLKGEPMDIRIAGSTQKLTSAEAIVARRASRPASRTV
jgi:trehalose/maltose hydrolase-like predicted phosphorylase